MALATSASCWSRDTGAVTPQGSLRMTFLAGIEPKAPSATKARRTTAARSLQASQEAGLLGCMFRASESRTLASLLSSGRPLACPTLSTCSSAVLPTVLHGDLALQARLMLCNRAAVTSGKA